MSQEINKELKQKILDSLTPELIYEEIINCKVKVKCREVDLVREACKLPIVRRQFTLARKNGRPMWDVEGHQLNPLQMRFLQWISFYENIDESMDRPPDRIVYNDKLLKNWLDNQHEEMEKRYEENWSKDTGGVQKSALDHQEVFEFEDPY